MDIITLISMEEAERELVSSQQSTSSGKGPSKLSKNDVLKLIGQESSRVSFFSTIAKSTKNAYKDWQCYKKMKIDEKIVPYVQCIQCKTVLSYSSDNGNSNLRKHKTHCDQEQSNALPDANSAETTSTEIGASDTDMSAIETIEVSSKIGDKSKKSGTKETKITSFMKKSVPLSCKIELNNNILRGLAKDIRPLSTVERPGFLHIAQSLINCGAKYGQQSAKNIIYGRKTLKTKNLPRLCLDEEARLEALLRNDSSFPKYSFTFDMWSEKYKQRSFLSLSIHLISDSWRLEKYSLGLTEFKYETAETANVRDACSKILKKYFNEEDVMKIFEESFAVTDCGGNMIIVFYKRFDCECHKLNTCMEWMFRDPSEKDFNEMMAKKKSIPKKKLFRLSVSCPSIKASFDAIRDLVTHFKHSKLNARLSNTLKQNVPTRFNSQIIMLKSYITAAKEVKQMLLNANELHRIALIDEKLVSEHIKLLQHFQNSSVVLSGDKYPTFQLVALEFHKLRNNIAISENDSIEIRNLKSQAQVCVEEYCKVENIHYVACMLNRM